MVARKPISFKKHERQTHFVAVVYIITSLEGVVISALRKHMGKEATGESTLPITCNQLRWGGVQLVWLSTISKTWPVSHIHTEEVFWFMKKITLKKIYFYSALFKPPSRNDQRAQIIPVYSLPIIMANVKRLQQMHSNLNLNPVSTNDVRYLLQPCNYSTYNQARLVW